MSEHPFDKIESIEEKSDLIEFLKLLEEDYKSNQDDWENITIGDYLESIRAWLNDSDEAMIDSEGSHSLKACAQLFYVGKIYE